MALTVGDVQVDAYLKELYPDGLPADLMMRKHPFLSLVPKDTDAEGEYIVVPVQIDTNPGRSGTAANAFDETNGPAGVSASTKFICNLKSDFALVMLNMLTVYKTQSNRGSFMAARKLETDNIITSLGNSLSHALYRGGDGAVGRVNSAVASPTITLSNRSDAKFFVVNALYQLQDGTSGSPGGALRNAGATVQCSAVNEDAGTVTFTGNLSAGIAAAAIGDFFVQLGDSNTKITGLAGWIPLATPSATLFNGVNRTIHPTRLAGSRLDQPTIPAQDTILELSEIMAERGAQPDRVFVSPRQFSKMARSMSAKIEYSDGGGTAAHGFAQIRHDTSAGSLLVTPDPDCPDTLGYILQMDQWRLKHLLDLPHFVVDDGLKAIRRSGADAISIRARYYAELVCYKPGAQGVFSCSL